MSQKREQHQPMRACGSSHDGAQNASAAGLLLPIGAEGAQVNGARLEPDGARAGSRTLNLGIKRLPTGRLRASQGTTSRLCRIREMTQSSLGVSRCLTESPGEAVNEAVKSEGAEAYMTRTAQQSAANRSVLTMSLSTPDRCWPSPAMDYSGDLYYPAR